MDPSNPSKAKPSRQGKAYSNTIPFDQSLSQEYQPASYDPVEVFGEDAAEPIVNAMEQKTVEIKNLDWQIRAMHSAIQTLPDGEGFTLKGYYQVALPRTEADRYRALRHLRRLEKQYDQVFKTSLFNRPIPKNLLDTQKLKDQVDIVSVIEQYIELRPAGASKYKARCPFHPDKTPSFIVYPDHFHCYGCQEHGDAITFLQRINSIDFKAAVAELGGLV